jgi:ABC-type lipoprotein release transport system permease subunit
VTATRLWARNELGRRWRALVVLGLIAGAAGGLALGAVVQAQRSADVYARYREATASPDAIVFGTQSQAGQEHFMSGEEIDYAGVIALPEVIDSGQFNLAPVAIEVRGHDQPLGGLPTSDSHLYRTLAKPLLRAGRLPDPERDDEVVVNELAARDGVEVGDKVTIVTATDVQAFFGGGGFDGPRIPATVVGIGNTPLDYIFTSGEPASYPSGAVLAKHTEVPRFGNLVVRLRPGTDVTAFTARAQAALGFPDVPVRDLAEDRKRFEHATSLERTALLLFAAAVALAGLVLAGQALARTVYAMHAAGPTLSALGLTRHEVIGGLVLPTVLTAAVAAASAAALAFALSERFTLGLSREIEPDLGMHADWSVLLPGAALLALIVVGGAVVAGLRATSRRAEGLPGRGLGVLRGIRSAAPLPVALGATMALESGRGQRSTPVRPALAGAVAGVLGIVGALGLVRGIDHALDSPRVSGQTFDGFLSPEDEDAIDPTERAANAEPLVQATALMIRRPLAVAGEGLPVYALESKKGNATFVVLKGSAPRSPDEVAVAPSSLKAIGRGVGDTIEIEGQRFRIVGTALLPQTAHSSFDQGAWLTPKGMDRIKEPGDRFGTEIAVQAKPGVSPDQLAEALAKRLPDAELDIPGPPQDVLLLRNVRTLPRVLAGFLGLLGVAALGHALVTAVRRRRNELAVLRALGFRPMQNAATIVWQATTVAVIGLLVGIPLGIAAGRVSWQWVADSTPLLYVAPIAGLAIALAVPGTLAVANALAALPARRAARLRAVDVLRAE